MSIETVGAIRYNLRNIPVGQRGRKAEHIRRSGPGMRAARGRLGAVASEQQSRGRLTALKYTNRVISGLLSLAMVGSLCTTWLPSAAAVSTQEDSARTVSQTTGSIALTIRFGLKQTAASVAKRGIQLRLTDGSQNSAVIDLETGEVTGTGLTAGQVSIEKQNVQGVALTTEEQIGYYQVVLSGLEADKTDGREYTLTLTGAGYADCTTTVTFQDYSKHVIVSTDDGTFSLGNVDSRPDEDGRNVVNSADLTAMDAQLGETGALDLYDLNGDGKVDITDLSYVNKMVDVTGDPKVLDTAAIVSATVEQEGLNVTDGSLENLFTGESTVTVAPAPEAEELSIPITLEQPTEMSEISITSPSTEGGIQAGTALVEVEGQDEPMEIPFDISAPAGTHAISRIAGANVVTIDLGKKVPVKKVTITVSKVEGQTGEKPAFATVTQIEFLKDIVSNAVVEDNQVKNLAATAGDGEITLIWDSVNNVTGYTVRYGTSKGTLDQSAAVSTNKAVISGLKNNKTYYFQVSATNGDWSGTPSAVLSAVPLPASVPGAPSGLSIEAADGTLRISWSDTKDATHYQVYYRVKGTETFLAWGGITASLGAVITGLTNDTEYEVAVKAGNNHGLGDYSAIAVGTPEKESIKMPELPTDGRIDNSHITSITMVKPGNVNTSLCPNFDVTTDLTDNDPNTYWVALDYNLPSGITYTLDGSYDMNYVLVVPYLSGKYPKCIKTFNLEARNAEGEVIYSANALPASGLINNGYVALAFPELKGVHSLTIGLNEVEGGGARVSISEIAFYESNTLSEDIAGLFANGSFTALQGDVDSERISALESRLSALSSFYMDRTRLQDELNLAKALLANKPNALALVKNDFQSRSAAADKAAGQSASDLQPLGITAKAGATVAIYAEVPGDAKVSVVFTQFYGESGIWKAGTTVELKNGRNYITVPTIGDTDDPRGGMLYLTYAGEHPEQIKLQIRNAANVWQMPVLELSNWYDLNETQRKDAIRAYVQTLSTYVSGLSGINWQTDIRNATEISTPSVLLSMPADQVLAGLKGVNNDEDAMVEAMYNNVLAWEEELFIANKVQGIIDSNATLETYRYPMTTRQNIRYMRMFAGAFMYAAGNHVGVEYGSTAALVQGKPTSVTGAGQANGLFGWGIAHEIGHNMDKLGKAECTNNIYSMALQAWDGASMTLNTRLTEDGRWEDIFNKVAQGRPGAANNVFVQLGMYWQLHLAYDEAEEPLAFFNRFFKLWKAGEYGSYSYDDRVALIASKVADRNLTEFFTRWGMTLSESAKAELGGYTDETRAIWYLNDASRTYRLNSGAAAEGTASVSASVSESEVTLTISHTDSDNILGYEIRRNGKAIAFTTETTYVDDLGAANNLTYTYAVVPVDKLGNLGNQAEAGEVRVAYDKTISADLYTVDKGQGTLTFTMKDEAAVNVTGIKVTDESEMSGAYTVTAQIRVTDGEGEAQERTVTVKNGTLSGTELVAYFTKPGAADDDTRIWTYSVVSLTITGLPENASVELLDYPGDRVDFYENATVGILKNAYGGIPAGTLVILGTYRGNPVYNTVEIQARYNTTPEAGSVSSIERAMNGELYLLAEIPGDGAVSDTSDGFFIFVPNMEAEKELNSASGVSDDYPIEIRAVLYRTDDPNSADSKRVTSQTLWISFPDGGDSEDTVKLPEIVLTGSADN